MLDAGGVEIETLDIGAAAGRDQEIAAGDALMVAPLAGRAAEHDRDARSARFDMRNGHALAQHDAFRRELVEQDARALGVFARKRRAGFQHGHRGAEPAECLRELEPHRPGADDDEMLRDRS